MRNRSMFCRGNFTRRGVAKRRPTGGPLLRAERERDAIGPAKSVLGRVFATAGPPIQIDDIVLLIHAAGCRVRLSVEREPAVAGLVGQVRSTVATNTLDGHPL